jgi:hypothetical protein
MLFPVLMLLATLVAIAAAPVGYEDEGGFHFGPPKKGQP